MKSIWFKALLTIVLTSISLVSVSKTANEYRCTVQKVYFLEEDGLLNPSKNGYMEGEEFTIDRITGKANGALKNHNLRFGRPCMDGSGFSKCNEPYVVDQGGNGQYFKSITIYGSNKPSVDYLIVQDFSEDEKKPFVYAHGGSITTGICSR